MDNSQALAIFRKCLEKFIEFNEAEWIVFIQHLSFSSSIKKEELFCRAPRKHVTKWDSL